MSDQTTPGGAQDDAPADTTPAAEPAPDTTPTEVINAVSPGAPPRRSTSTRTILEIVGGAAAAVLIVVAAGAGFVAGLVVGDEGDRHREYGQARGMDDDAGRGYDDRGRGYGDGMGRGFDHHGGPDRPPMDGSLPPG